MLSEVVVASTSDFKLVELAAYLRQSRLVAITANGSIVGVTGVSNSHSMFSVSAAVEDAK